jgi:hypothetical protein
VQHNTEPQRGPKFLHIPEVLSLIELFGVTKYMKHSPYGEANIFVNIQEIPFVLFNLKDFIHTPKAWHLFLSSDELSHNITFCFLKIHFNIILASTPGSLECCFLEVFHPKTLCALLL